MSGAAETHLTWSEPADPIADGDSMGVLTNDLDDLPEMAPARARGFEGEIPEAPGWTWIWILWPRSHRAWLPDRRVRFGWSYDAVDGEPSAGKQQMWPTWEYAEVEMAANSSLSDLGLPHRPAGRLWLLRPPSRFAALDAAFTEIMRLADEREIRVVPWPGLLEPVQQIVAELFDGDRDVVW